MDQRKLGVQRRGLMPGGVRGYGANEEKRRKWSELLLRGKTCGWGCNERPVRALGRLPGARDTGGTRSVEPP